MRGTVIRNMIRCVHCGAEVESAAGYDLRRHTCASMQTARGPDAYIAADGGLEYLRRVGHPADWIEASTTEPPIDAAEEEALRQRRIDLLASDEMLRGLDRLQKPDAHVRLERVMESKGVARVPPIAGKPSDS